MLQLNNLNRGFSLFKESLDMCMGLNDISAEMVKIFSENILKLIIKI